jgi:hypothetical protein
VQMSFAEGSDREQMKVGDHNSVGHDKTGIVVRLWNGQELSKTV